MFQRAIFSLPVIFFDPMDWIVESVNKGIYRFFADLANDVLANAFNTITDFIISMSDINKYMNVSSYLIYAKLIAGSALTAVVAWELLKEASGGMIASEDKSIGVYMLQVVWAVFLIQFLPFSVTNILLPINNALIGLIQEIGVKITVDKFDKYLSLTENLDNLSGLLVIMLLILGVAFLILGVAAAKRYAELLISVIIAPFAAISAVRGGDAIAAWLTETSIIIFTQAAHIFLLQLLLKMMATINGFMMYVFSIGLISVMLSGPMVLRKYISNTGSGGRFVKSSKAAVVKTIANAYMGR